MPTAARFYVALPCLGNFAHCEQVADELVVAVDAVNQPVAVMSLYARTLLKEGGVAEEWLDEASVNSATSGRYPFLWVSITFNPERTREADLAQIEALFGLRQVGSVESPLDMFGAWARVSKR